MENHTSNPVSTASTSGLKDAIVTLPKAAIAGLIAFILIALGVAAGLAIYFENDGLKSAAMQLTVLMVPVGIAIVAAIGIRQTSTKQIDQLINGFLEKTMLERLENWCLPTKKSKASEMFPFRAVQLMEPVGGRSYAYFKLSWRDKGLDPVQVGVKMNVFNFEVFTQLALSVDADQSEQLNASDLILNASKLDALHQHPVLKHFKSTIQGSIHEGYEVKTQFGLPVIAENGHRVEMHISLRQKVRENFVTSPFLKRYYSEDAAILIGVLFSEYKQSGFMPSSKPKQNV